MQKSYQKFKKSKKKTYIEFNNKTNLIEQK